MSSATLTTGSAAPAQRLTERPAWKALEDHYATMRHLHLRQLFAEDPRRGERLTAEAAGIYLDYSKQHITDETIRLLVQLAEECGLRERIAAMFRGERINVTEKRAVLHTALRAPETARVVVDGVDVVPEVHAVLERMAAFSLQVRSGEWQGYTGKRIRNIINIGIGGSDLGPVMAYEALRYYSQRDMIFRFVSNVDGTDFEEATRDLDPEETLFIICSKTFTTLETLTNAHAARAWNLRKLGDDRAVQALRRRICQRRRRLPIRHRYREYVRLLGLGRRALLHGLGNRAVDHDCHRTGELLCDARRLSRDGSALPQRAIRAEFARAHGNADGMEQQLLRCADGRGTALRALSQTLSRLPAATDNGEQRQTRDARWYVRRLANRAHLLGRTRHQRPALVLSAYPPGNPTDPL